MAIVLVEEFRPMLSSEDVLRTVEKIEFIGWPLGWRFTVKEDLGLLWLAAEFERADTNTGEIGWGRGRGWPILKEWTEEAVVKTAFAATKAILDHEAHEGFLYNGARLFDPHFTLDELADTAQRIAGKKLSKQLV